MWKQFPIVGGYNENLMESHISNAEISGLILEEKGTKLSKPQFDVHDIDTINTKLTDER